MEGIDVSSNNGTVNWQEVKNAGVEFAMIRCGFGQDIAAQDDKQFAKNVEVLHTARNPVRGVPVLLRFESC